MLVKTETIVRSTRAQRGDKWILSFGMTRLSEKHLEACSGLPEQLRMSLISDLYYQDEDYVGLSSHGDLTGRFLTPIMCNQDKAAPFEAQDWSGLYIRERMNFIYVPVVKCTNQSRDANRKCE